MRTKLVAIAIASCVATVLPCLASAGVPLPTYPCSLVDQHVVFDYTGAMQVLSIPADVQSSIVIVHAYGAQGGSGDLGAQSSPGGTGGLGSSVAGVYQIGSGGFDMNVFVGGQGATPTGGFNGGGNGGNQNSGGGGGASDIRINDTDPASRIFSAAGGGGGGRGGCESSGTINGGNGGGGGQDGVNGTDAATSGGVAGGGAGGAGAAGGAPGLGCSGFLGVSGTTATTEVGGNGGDGQTCCCFTLGSIPGGGGGGGGLLGGGGGGGGSAGTPACSGNDKGGGGGGAGGINSTGSLVNTDEQLAVREGNGQIELCYRSGDVIFIDGFDYSTTPVHVNGKSAKAK